MRQNPLSTAACVNYLFHILVGWLKFNFLHSAIYSFSVWHILHADFNSTVTWLIVNAKNGLDFALGHLSNFVYIYITVEECWRKGMCVLHLVYKTHLGDIHCVSIVSAIYLYNRTKMIKGIPLNKIRWGSHYPFLRKPSLHSLTQS